LKGKNIIIQLFYVFLSILTGVLASTMFFRVGPSSDINFKILGILFFISFLGHIISFWRELDREEESYRQKIKDNK